mgnify:FL=1
MTPVNTNKDVDDDVAIINATLKSFVNIHNKSIKEKGE